MGSHVGRAAAQTTRAPTRERELRAARVPTQEEELFSRLAMVEAGQLDWISCLDAFKRAHPHSASHSQIYQDEIENPQPCWQDMSGDGRDTVNVLTVIKLCGCWVNATAVMSTADSTEPPT